MAEAARVQPGNDGPAHDAFTRLLTRQPPDPGQAVVPVDVRVYADATDGLTRNVHLRAMLTTAAERRFTPRGCSCAVDAEFEIWYVDLTREADGRLVPSEPKQLITAENIDATSGLTWSSS